MNTFYHHFFEYSDPNCAYSDPTGTLPPYQFSDELMAAHGVPRLPIVYSAKIFPSISEKPGYDASGPIDERKFRQTLTRGDNDGTIPQHSIVMVDIEAPEWDVYHNLPEEHLWYQPHQQGIDWRLELLELAKRTRPDCKFGFYGQIPYLPFEVVVHQWQKSIPLARRRQIQQWRRELQVACWPLAEQCDVLFPYFYDRYDFDPAELNTFEYRLKWIRAGLAEARYFGRPFYVVLWPEDLTYWRARPTPDTPEHQKMRQLSGYYWLRYNQLAVAGGATGVVWWGGFNGQGGTPWDETAEWWEAAKELLSRADRRVT